MSKDVNSERNYFLTNFKETSLILEASKRLKLSSVTFSTACSIYHLFCKKAPNELRKRLQNGDILGPTALYLAAKAEEEPMKIRDVVNVCYRILHAEELPLEIGERYWNLRDSIQNCELYILRVLDFQVSFDSPQKYLLNYLNSLKSWVSPLEWSNALVPQISWNLLQDSFHSPLCITVKPEVVSLAALFVAVNCANLKISTEGGNVHWWQAFNREMSEDELQKIATSILNIYHSEHIKEEQETRN